MANQNRDPDRSARLVQSVIVAVLVHLALLPVLDRLMPDAPAVRRSRPIRIVQAPTSKRAAKPKQNKTPKEQEIARKKKEKEEREKPPEPTEGQVVALPPSPDDRPPEDAKYLSEHNTRTERETRSRFQSKNYKNALNEVSRAEPPQQAEPSANPERPTAIEIGPENPSPEQEQEKVAGKERAFELPTLRHRDHLALQLDPDLGALLNQSASESLAGNSNRLKLSPGEEPSEPSQRSSAGRAGPPKLDLVPSLGVLAKLSGGPANDHLEGLEEADGTFLNSREFKYASFFNRLKEGVSQHWNPLPEYRRRDPSGNIYGQTSRVTVLKVKLNIEGQISDLEVERSSGVTFLDDEAVAAFRRAEPFPNPPRGLVDQQTGLIDFPFGFHVDFSRSGGLNLPF